MTLPIRNNVVRGAGALRTSAALTGAKLTSRALRLSGRGGGTASPGLVATVIDPDLLAKLTRQLEGGVIVVAGTNGKTTTSRLLYEMLEADGRKVIHNRSGSNLLRGVVSAFADQASVIGRLSGSVGVIEADEAAFPDIVYQTQPRLILLTNLFRDQLDRYGELDTIARRWKSSLSKLPSTSFVVYNADDPALCALAESTPAQTVPFGIDPGRYALSHLPHAADAATCRRCGADLRYLVHTSSHLGDWFCSVCSWKRPELVVEGEQIVLDGVTGLRLSVARKDRETLRLESRIPGLYNVYNLVAAAAAATSLDVSDGAIVTAARDFVAPFGRIQAVKIHGRTVTLILVKNPVGFNEVLRMLTLADEGLVAPTLIAINDLDADGRDVSWLWDVDFEVLAPGRQALRTAGIRGPDMANRLKYAGVAETRLGILGEELRPALYSFADSLPVGGSGYILATYTAMMDMHRVLAEDQLTPAFWQQ